MPEHGSHIPAVDKHSMQDMGIYHAYKEIGKIGIIQLKNNLTDSSLCD